MTFKDQLALDISAFFNTNEFADEISYQPAAGGDAIDTDACIEWGENPEIKSTQESTRETGIIYLKNSDVGAPKYRDSFTFGSVTYHIMRIIEGMGHVWACEFQRDVRPAFFPQRGQV